MEGEGGVRRSLQGDCAQHGAAQVVWRRCAACGVAQVAAQVARDAGWRGAGLRAAQGSAAPGGAAQGGARRRVACGA
eukprot:3849361-Prymnesium_polylepis.1